ncbi:hypothetical protein VTH8203_01503 [Vibrio thalassae]|uniref:Uncharacterized protein n=1 Tax=Vibrio thalassae TaxID=1243014 RepID=A0A240EGS5_9VIBR|nr:hypothetical protein [Vibrio thalassae]SNX47888.1 hypothetical protein VTH8203_01503 [Vibrio thalassae]
MDVNKLKATIDWLYENSNYGDCSYREYDFSRDLKIAEKYAEKTSEFIFISRPSGTMLFPVAVGINPIHATYHSTHEDCECYLIDSQLKVKDISAEKVAELANRQPTLPSDREGIINTVKAILSDSNVKMSGLISCSIESTDVVVWSRYIQWFKTCDHPVMEAFLNNALARLSKAA